MSHNGVLSLLIDGSDNPVMLPSCTIRFVPSPVCYSPHSLKNTFRQYIRIMEPLETAIPSVLRGTHGRVLQMFIFANTSSRRSGTKFAIFTNDVLITDEADGSLLSTKLQAKTRSRCPKYFDLLKEICRWPEHLELSGSYQGVARRRLLIVPRGEGTENGNLAFTARVLETTFKDPDVESDEQSGCALEELQLEVCKTSLVSTKTTRVTTRRSESSTLELLSRTRDGVSFKSTPPKQPSRLSIVSFPTQLDGTAPANPNDPPSSLIDPLQSSVVSVDASNI